MYDVIVVGARCAGSPTAMLLAQRAHRVLLVDRDTFPSDTISTAFLQPDAVRRLAEWGILERLVAAGTPGVHMVAPHWNGMRLPVQPADEPAYAPRRTVLDELLVEAAHEAGAEVRTSFSVQDLLFDADGAVVGIVGQLPDGTPVMEEARVVVGADGRNSFVARQVAAEEYNVVEPHSCGFYGFFDGPPLDEAQLHLNARHAFFYFPTNGNQVCIGIEAPLEKWDEFRKDTDGYFNRAIAELAAPIAERMKGARLDGRYLGMTGRRSFFRKPYGPGWALAGDAGFLKDPILGTGIDDAFRDAEMLATALDDGLSGRRPLEDALAGYHAGRDAAVEKLYPVVCEFAEMKEVTPEMLGRMIAARAPEPAGAGAS